MNLQLNTQSRYALRAVLELAKEYDNSMPLSKISESQYLSLRYLEQIFAKLKKAGIVKSLRGVKGGYYLAKEPKEILVGEIIEIFEEFYPTECLKDNECDMIEKCLTKNLWAKLKHNIDEVLFKTTLEDLLKS